MINLIQKFVIDIKKDVAGNGKFILYIPHNSVLLKGRSMAPGEITFWIKFNKAYEREDRNFFIVPTGKRLPFDQSMYEYFDTVFDDELGLVWHIFEEKV